jgi:hypothetical protein
MSYMNMHPTWEQGARERRQRRIMRGQLSWEGWVYPILIRNLSVRGIGASSQEPIPAGISVSVMLPGGQAAKGVVRWSSGKSFGIQLEEELDVEALSRHMERRLNSAREEGKWEVRSLHRVNTPQPLSSTRRRL